MDYRRVKVIAGAYGTYEVDGLQVRRIKKLVLPFNRNYYDKSLGDPDIVELWLYNPFDTGPDDQGVVKVEITR